MQDWSAEGQRPIGKSLKGWAVNDSWRCAVLTMVAIFRQQENQTCGEVNPATQQIDFYIRSPQQNPKNKPTREVFMHFFGMEVTWK